MATTFENPTPERIEWHMQEARRMRSEAVHALLESAATWIAVAFRARTPRRSGIGVASTARA
jgi:hypothetical protein